MGLDGEIALPTPFLRWCTPESHALSLPDLGTVISVAFAKVPVFGCLALVCGIVLGIGRIRSASWGCFSRCLKRRMRDALGNLLVPWHVRSVKAREVMQGWCRMRGVFRCRPAGLEPRWHEVNAQQRWHGKGGGCWPHRRRLDA